MFKRSTVNLIVNITSALWLLAGPSFAANYSKEVEELLSEGNRLYQLRQYTSAKAQFNEALKLEPNCPDAYNWLGLCVDKEENRQAARGCFMLAIKLNPNFYEGLYNLANSYYLDHDYSQSIAYYLRALKARDKAGLAPDPDLFASLGSVYRDRAATLTGLPKQQDMKRALDFYQRSLSVNPRNPQAYGMLGKLYYDYNQPSAAERTLRTAVSLDPKYAYAFYWLGKIYKQKHEYPAALVAFRNSLKFEKRDDYKQDTEAEILSLGLPRQLIDNFAQGYEELSLQNFELAESEFQAASGQTSNAKAIALNNYGFSLAKSGNTAAAIDAYRKAIKLAPRGMPETHYNLGQALLQTKRYAEAEEAFKQCLNESKGKHFLAHNALGIIYKNNGKLDEALKHYNLALMQSGDSLSVVQFNRGLVFEALGKKQEAIACYTKYLQCSPNGFNAAAAKERLERIR